MSQQQSGNAVAVDRSDLDAVSCQERSETLPSAMQADLDWLDSLPKEERQRTVELWTLW